MADPTLKDVLKAIAAMRDEMATKAEMNGMKADMSSRFDRVDRGIAELDRDVTNHMAVHREIEKDIEMLKKRPARTAARATRTPRGR